jgi:hypothetical protein
MAISANFNPNAGVLAANGSNQDDAIVVTRNAPGGNRDDAIVTRRNAAGVLVINGSAVPIVGGTAAVASTAELQLSGLVRLKHRF